MELLSSLMEIFQMEILFLLFPLRMIQLLDAKIAEHIFVPLLDG